MVKKIIWTPKAEKSFDAVINYLQEHWSQKEVISFVRKVDVVVFHIARFPFSYHSAGKDDIREALITKHNLLLYRIAGNTIYVLYFWDTRKNPMRKPV